MGHFGTKFEEELGRDQLRDEYDKIWTSYEPSAVAFCQIILVLVYEFGS